MTLWVGSDKRWDDTVLDATEKILRGNDRFLVDATRDVFFQDARTLMHIQVDAALRGRMTPTIIQELLTCSMPKPFPPDLEWELIILIGHYISEKHIFAGTQRIAGVTDPVVRRALGIVMLSHRKYTPETISNVIGRI